MRGMFDILLSNLIIEYKLEENTQTSNSHLVEVLKYIDAHYKENLTLEEISNHFGYTTFYFSKLFKAKYSMSPQQYRKEQY